MKYKLPSTKITETEFWTCDRCKINSQGKQMCPCPRGSCEAEHVGTVTTTVVVTITPPVVKPSTNQFDQGVEEMNCPACKAITGHIIKNKRWTCVHCETPLK